MNIEVSVDPSNVTVTHTSLTGGTNPAPAKKLFRGQFDGTSIRASGRQAADSRVAGGTAYDCTLTLTRA
jgi:hypothetical protein